MAMNEVSVQYNVPVNILKEYESWGLCNAVKKAMAHGSMMARILGGLAWLWHCMTLGLAAAG